MRKVHLQRVFDGLDKNFSVRALLERGEFVDCSRELMNEVMESKPSDIKISFILNWHNNGYAVSREELIKWFDSKNIRDAGIDRSWHQTVESLLIKFWASSLHEDDVQRLILSKSSSIGVASGLILSPKITISDELALSIMNFNGHTTKSVRLIQCLMTKKGFLPTPEVLALGLAYKEYEISSVFKMKELQWQKEILQKKFNSEKTNTTIKNNKACAL